MSDLLIKSLGFKNSARIYLTLTTESVNYIGDKLQYFPSALDALGQTMSIATIMGGTLKKDETVTIRVEGDGPIGKIIVDADAYGHIKGYAQNPHVHLENNNQTLNVESTIGTKGTITVIKDLHLKEPFIGYSPILGSGLAKDFAYYFNISEQTPTAIMLGCTIDTDSRAISSGGLMIQLLPNTKDEIIDEIESIIKSLPPLSEMLASGYSLYDILHNIDKDALILEETPVEYKCNCSKDRFAKGILSLGSKEIKDIIDKDGFADTVCHFCSNKYHFDKSDLEALYNEALIKEENKSKS